MTPDQLRILIRYVLKKLGWYSSDAVELLMLTAAAESNLGQYIYQVGGPALGIYQMEPTTHDDIWDNYLSYNQSVADKIHQFAITGHLYDYDIKGHGPEAEQMAGNLYYSTAMARALYRRFPEALPNGDDVASMARYYKRYWNTHLGASEVDKTIKKYRELAL